MKTNIIPEKIEYFPNEVLKGIIRINPKTQTKIKDIKLTLLLNEDWSVYGDVNSQNNNNIKIFSYNIGVCSMFQKPENTLIDLEGNKNYEFPFDQKLPDYLLPSFEFHNRNCLAFLRYILRAKVITEKEQFFSNVFLNIKATPREIKDDDDLNVKSSLSLKKWGLFNKGKTNFIVNYVTKNYKITDEIPIEVVIDNSNSKMSVVKCKLTINRKVTLKNKVFADVFNYDDHLIEKEFNILVDKKEKKKFNFLLDLNTIKYDNYGKELQYQNKEIKDLLPSLNGNIITCEYSLTTQIKYEHKVENIPQITLPIYIVHKLSDDHLEKAKEEARKLREEANFIDDFEIVDGDKEKNEINEEKNEEKKEEKNEEKKEDKIEEKKEEKEDEKKEENKDSNKNNNIINLDDNFKYSDALYQKNFDEFDLINRKTVVNYPSFDDNNINYGDNNDNNKDNKDNNKDKNNNNNEKININDNNKDNNDNNKDKNTKNNNEKININDNNNINNKENLGESTFCLFSENKD